MTKIKAGHKVLGFMEHLTLNCMIFGETTGFIILSAYLFAISLLIGCTSVAQPSITPDAKDVAVTSIRRVDVNTHIDSYLTWVPSQENSVATVVNGFVDGGIVYVHDLNTGKSEKLLDLKDHSMPPGYMMNFFWSTEGKRLVTGAGWVVNLEKKSGDWIKLPEGVKSRHIEVLGLSPDEKTLLVDVVYEGLFFVDEATGQYRQFVVNSSVFPPHMRILAWSPDGKWVAVRTYDPKAKTIAEEAPSPLYLLRADGQEARLITPNIAGRIDRVSFSPDGSKLMWDETYNNGNQSIFIANLDGSGAHEIFSNAGLSPEYNITSNLLWSPDGNRIVYVGPPDKDFTYPFWILTLGESANPASTPKP